MSNPKATNELVESKKSSLRRLIDRNKERKGAPTQSSMKSFIEDWTTLARAVGINEDTIDLLYDGFKIAAGVPLYRYVLESGDGGAYAKLFAAKRTQDNTNGEAVALGINLLALEIGAPSIGDSLESITEKLPQIAARGSKQSTSVIKKSMERLLIAPLSTVRLGEVACTRNARNLYLLLKGPLEEFIGDPDKKSGSVNTARALLGWLAKSAGEAPSIESSIETSAAGNREEEDNQSIGISGVIGFLIEYQREHEALEKSARQLSRELSEAKSDASESRAKLEDCMSRMEDAEAYIQELEDELAESRDSLRATAAELATLRHDLSEAQLMLDTTAERDAHKEDAAARRMAQKLSREYRDFLNALDEPMDVDLGEMLRDQLRTVFDILRSYGVEL